MLSQPLMEKLLAMRWQGMVEGLKTQEKDRAIHELSFLERLSLLVDQQWNWRENQALERRLKAFFFNDTATTEIYTTFFGGISQYYWDAATKSLKHDELNLSQGIDGLPF